MFVCLFVTKDLANRLTSMVPPYRVASHMYVLGRFITITTTLQPPQKMFKLKFKMVAVVHPPTEKISF